jgi:hypothetical protein
VIRNEETTLKLLEEVAALEKTFGSAQVDDETIQIRTVPSTTRKREVKPLLMSSLLLSEVERSMDG